MSKLILVRGIPGSGKTTYVKNNYPDFEHYEADMFFEDSDGNYKYDSLLIKTAHEWCYSNVVRCIYHNRDVVVSNTFVERWSMDRYIQLVEENQYLDFHIVELHTSYGSIHDVPENVVQRMKDKWYTFPSETDTIITRII